MAILLSSDGPPMFATAMLLLWWFLSGQNQVSFVAARIGDRYGKRRWTVPVVLGFLCFVLALAVAAEILAVMHPDAP